MSELAPKPGRPSSYRAEYAEQASKLCKLGATDRDLADFFEVAESTINLWKISHPEFSESLRLGKEEADARVVQSLYRRATGYSHDAVHISQFRGTPVIVPYVEHHAPDTTACIFWLKNRKPAEWRDKVEQQLSGPDGGPIPVQFVELVAVAHKPDDSDKERVTWRVDGETMDQYLERIKKPEGGQ